MSGWGALTRMWMIALFLVIALVVGLGVGLGVAFAGPTAPAVSGYLLHNTNTGHNAESEGYNGQLDMGTSKSTNFVRINYYDDGGIGYYSYEAPDGYCMKEDPNINGLPVVLWNCASGHTTNEEQEELWTTDQGGDCIAHFITDLYEGQCGESQYVSGLKDNANQLWNNCAQDFDTNCSWSLETP